MHGARKAAVAADVAPTDVVAHYETQHSDATDHSYCSSPPPPSRLPLLAPAAACLVMKTIFQSLLMFTTVKLFFFAASIEKLSFST